MADGAASPPATEHSTTITASTSQHQKRSENDRISRLPDDLLGQMLSFIPIKEAIGTSVLSKRWKHVWTSVPTLNISDDGSTVNVSSFINFVDKVLNLHTSTFPTTFRLICKQDYDFSHVDRWIRATVTRDIVNLYLVFYSESHLVTNLDQSLLLVKPLPNSFFHRKNLVTLFLHNIAIKTPASVHFPCLKYMHLFSVQFVDDDSLKNLLCGSPVLNTLDMSRTAWDNANTLYICSSTLVTLNLRTSRCVNKNSGYKVVIEAPSLTVLHLNDYVDDDYDVRNLSSLEILNLQVSRDANVSPNWDVFNDRLFKLFRRVSHVRDLTLGWRSIQCLMRTNLKNLPMFTNLTRLLVMFDCVSWLVLPYLLECSPNLITFIFYKEIYDVHVPGIIPQWKPPHCVPKCLLSSVVKFVINGFGDRNHALVEMIKYFLKNARVLKELLISSPYLGAEKRSKFLAEIETFPRSSSTCQIILS